LKLGYIGSLSLLETIVRVVKKLREYNADLIYVCDPVMGDGGRLYVKPEIVPAFRDQVWTSAGTALAIKGHLSLADGLSWRLNEGLASIRDQAEQGWGMHQLLLHPAEKSNKS
jgi:hypothetical protein